MKRFLILLFSCVVLLCSMDSCGVPPQNAEAQPSDNTIVSEPAPQNPESVFDAEAAYADILSECSQFLSAPKDSTEYPDGLFGIYEAAMVIGAEAADTIGYVFRDINEDSIPELLIGTFDKDSRAYTKNEIYAAYTHDGQQPVLLFSGWARNSYALTEDNTFDHHGSGGAAYSIYGEYMVSDGGEFQCIHAYFTYPKNEEMTEIGYYHNTSGIMDPAEAEEWSVTADEFWAAGDAIAAKTAKLSATPFSAYTKADAASAS